MTVRETSRPLRVTLGEDDVLLREGIARILTGAGLDVVAQSGDADDLLHRTLAHLWGSSTCRCRRAERTTAGPPSNCAGASRRSAC